MPHNTDLQTGCSDMSKVCPRTHSVRSLACADGASVEVTRPSLTPRRWLLGERFEKPAHLETYARVRLDLGEQGTIAWSSGGQGSAAMHGLGAADALAVLPVGQSVFAAGTTVRALLLP
jgi:molybdopterin biosynthesis enzyme